MSVLLQQSSAVPRPARKVQDRFEQAYYPSSSGQTSQGLRHKSPASRHLSPHRSVSRSKILYNSVRKTQSSALASVRHGLWPRGTTASTPELKVEDQGVGTEANHPEGFQGGRYGSKSCISNLKIIAILLNIILLLAGLIYLAGGVLMTIYRELLLILLDQRLYFLCTIAFYMEAVLLLSISGLQLRFVNRSGFLKWHISCSLLIAVLTISSASLQNSIENSSKSDLKHRLVSSIRLEPEIGTRTVWDYIQETMMCCGARGYLDWCQKSDVHDSGNSTDLLGAFTCNLPASCCIKKEDTPSHSENTTPCVISPTPWSSHRVGCLAYVTREMNYAGKLYRNLCFGTGIVLFLSSAVSAVIFVNI